jgi:serine acetyltransferase
MGNDVCLGVREIVLLGVRMGARSIAAAGAVVTRDVPPNSVVGGVPARVLCTTDDYLERMKEKSLHLGYLSGAEKEVALRQHFARDERSAETS